MMTIFVTFISITICYQIEKYGNPSIYIKNNFDTKQILRILKQ